MKIGIYPGSFNPVHNSHIKITKTLTESILDKIIYVPCNNEYNKDDLIDSKYRYDMLKLIIDDNKSEVSKFELDELKDTYETMIHFKNKYEKDDIYLILGSDNYKNLYNWSIGELLIKEFKIIVINREKKNIKPYNNNIKIINKNVGKLSSTYIRYLVKNKKYEELKNNINIKVYNYIIINKLYLDEVNSG